MATSTTALGYVEYEDNIGHIADQGGEIADLDLNHSDDVQYSTMEPAAQSLAYARSQYPMMDMVLITASIILICICCWSIRGWTKFSYDTKLDKIEFEMTDEQKVNEQGIEPATIDSAANLSAATPNTHTFSPISCDNASDDKIIDTTANHPPSGTARFHPQFIDECDDDDESLIIV